MKLFLLLLLGLQINLLLLGHAHANSEKPQAYKIPRSSIINITDPVSQRTYPIFVQIPKSYKSNTEQTYPVIYMTDGRYSFEVVSGATRLLMGKQLMHDAILVGISYATSDKGAASRTRDYTPTKDSNWKLNTGEAKQHAGFIKNTVFNYVDKHYRTQQDNRTFIGHSFGGLFGTYVLFTSPSMFKNYIISSPSYWWHHRYMFNEEAKFANRVKNLEANIYFAIGEYETTKYGANYEMVTDTERFYNQALQWPSDNLNLKFNIISEADHFTAFPTASVQGIKWALGKCNLAPNCL